MKKVAFRFGVQQFASIVLAMCSIWLTAQSPAQAQFQLCNGSPIPVYSASTYHQNGQWRAKGWYKIWPEDCKELYKSPLSHHSVYYHAHSKMDQTWGDENGQGYYFCTNTSAFDLAQNNCDPAQRKKFAAKSVNGKTYLTLRLNCATACKLPIVDYDRKSSTATLYNVFSEKIYGNTTIYSDVRAYVSVSEAGSLIKAKVNAFVDLSDVRIKLPSVLREATYVDTECAEKFDLFNTVLDRNGRVAELSTEGRYILRKCTSMDLPQIKCDGWEFWRQCQTWIDTTQTSSISISQQGSATLRITPRIVANTQIRFDVDVTRARLGGLAQYIVDMFNIDLKSWVKRGIDGYLPDDLLNYALPPEILPYLRITNIGFQGEGESFGLSIDGEAMVPKEDMPGLCAKFWPEGRCRVVH
ncbi:DUF1036 domain-containing protein [Rhizobium leguminosarum]|uniref:DUF1036 domain-containing protein n=1 Tax=Rhizobium leguminosarum TaxID=384 RepID=A0A7K3VUR5_RHILE|nr:DUF1036 domain-containing protein [Rhizobium leguminosarum]NEK19891.1 DUF1036 domain-containing protein [Rhizobium leguminosarum]